MLRQPRRHAVLLTRAAVVAGRCVHEHGCVAGQEACSSENCSSAASAPPAAGHCANCSAGYYDHDENPGTRCLPCLPGTYSAAASTVCHECAAGEADVDQDAATLCTVCGEKQHSAAAATSCEPVDQPQIATSTEEVRTYHIGIVPVYNRRCEHDFSANASDGGQECFTRVDQASDCSYVGSSCCYITPMLSPMTPIQPGAVCVQADYRGHKNTSASGRTCARWKADYVATHSASAGLVLDQVAATTPVGWQGRGHAFCRNPDKASGAWCFTTDPNMDWEFCELGMRSAVPCDAWAAYHDDWLAFTPSSFHPYVADGDTIVSRVCASYTPTLDSGVPAVPKVRLRYVDGTGTEHVAHEAVLTKAKPACGACERSAARACGAWHAAMVCESNCKLDVNAPPARFSDVRGPLLSKHWLDRQTRSSERLFSRVNCVPEHVAA